MLSGCASFQIMEDRLYKTRVYAGYYLKSIPCDKKHVTVLTSEGIFKIRGNPQIPDSIWCYIKVRPSFYDVDISIKWRLEPKLLTWEGCDNEYLICNDVKPFKY